MKHLIGLIICVVMLLMAKPAVADTGFTCTTPTGAISCTGTLATPEDVFLDTFTLASATDITVQTYGFGGGTNAAGAAIPADGFDSLVALFSGTATTATILTDGIGNPLASDPATTQFFSGCGPAGMVAIGGVPTCGDNQLAAALGPGTYTLLLSDADYIPYAVSPGPPTSSLLSDGYADLSGGVFQTCDNNGNCISPDGNFAVDITGLPASTNVPEPATLLLLGSSLLGLGFLYRRR